MTKYQPNFADPRVIKRLDSAVKFSLANLSPTKPRKWGTRQIDRWYGQGQKNISLWLRNQLLIVDNPYYNYLQDRSAKSYLLNMEGVNNILIALKKEPIIPSVYHLQAARIDAAKAIHKHSIESGVFEYREVSNRLWNDIQNIDSEIRKPLFANYGYIHEYDIKTAAPTVLTRYARQCGLKKKIPTIEAYLADPGVYRKRLADLLEVDVKTAKRLITSRFAGARFGPRNSILRELGGRWLLHDRLKEDTWFTDLTRDIKKMWDAIKRSDQIHKLNSQVKWSIYFQEELKIMRSVHRYLEKQNILYFHEHDGWRSTQAVAIRELQLYIQARTGYWVEFDYETV